MSIICKYLLQATQAGDPTSLVVESIPRMSLVEVDTDPTVFVVDSIPTVLVVECIPTRLVGMAYNS